MTTNATRLFMDSILASLEGDKRAFQHRLRSGPAGRRPDPKDARIHEWFSQLLEEDKGMVNEVVDRAMSSAVFGLLCVLDGVRGGYPLGNDQPSQFSVYLEELHAGTDISQQHAVRPSDSEPDLHDQFNLAIGQERA